MNRTPDDERLAPFDPRYEQWLAEERRLVYRLALGFLADPAEAEDATQEALMKIVVHAPQLDPLRPVGPWRAALVANVCRDLRRKAQTRRTHETLSAVNDCSPLPDPKDASARDDVRDILIHSLQALTEREREVFVLRELEGQETATVAVTLGIGESTVRTLLTLARRRLRATLSRRLGQSLNDSTP